MKTERFTAGATLGPYRIEALLGEGGMGEVYAAVHEGLGRPVAIKTLKPSVSVDREQLERFFQEARAVNVVRHENIVECTDLVHEPEGRSYIVMERLEGRTLAAELRRGPFSPRRAVRIAAQVADALDAAHGKGVIHRDVKPDNIFLIDRAGTPDYVKVLDFGIARLRRPEGNFETGGAAILGTPAYMSPEQARGETATPASDIYSLAIVLFEMVTGRLPFDAPTPIQLLMAHVGTTPPQADEVNSDVPWALAVQIYKGMEKSPNDRHQSLRHFRKGILGAVGYPDNLHGAVLAAMRGFEFGGDGVNVACSEPFSLGALMAAEEAKQAEEAVDAKHAARPLELEPTVLAAEETDPVLGSLGMEIGVGGVSADGRAPSSTPASEPTPALSERELGSDSTQRVTRPSLFARLKAVFIRSNPPGPPDTSGANWK